MTALERVPRITQSIGALDPIGAIEPVSLNLPRAVERPGDLAARCSLQPASPGSASTIGYDEIRPELLVQQMARPENAAMRRSNRRFVAEDDRLAFARIMLSQA